MPVVKFTKEIEAYVMANYHHMCGAEMAVHLGVRKDLITVNMRKLNLKSPKELWIKYRAKNQKKDYSKDLAFIKENFPKYDGKTLAKMMKISSIKIYQLAREAGFSDLIEQRKKQTRIQAGNVPPNKGKKWDDFLSKEKQEKIKAATHFQKGGLPHNTKPFGSVRLGKDGYLIIKTKEIHKNRNFVPIHHLIYESFYGPIGEKEIVRFKNGNKYDLNPDNLEKVTMAQHLIINRFNDESIAKKHGLIVNEEVKKLTQNIRTSKLLQHEINRKSAV